ncbi:MAG: hemolysin family protein [Bryobacteraceae bacterium]
MTLALLVVGLVAVLLVPVCFLQLLYLESLRLRAREQPALEWFKEHLEERIGLPGERGALTFSLVKHGLLVLMGVLLFAALERGGGVSVLDPATRSPVRAVAETMVLAWFGTVLVAHLIPQLLYRRTSGHWLVAMLPLIHILALLMRPLLAFLSFLRSLADLGAPEENVDESTSQSEDIEALISAGAEEGLIEEEDRKLIQSVVEFGDKTVREVMTPRPNIVAIAEEASLEQLRQLVAREQYSRVPVFDGSIDNIVGFVHVRDLVEIEPGKRDGLLVRDLKRTIIVVPETKFVTDLMREMQLGGVQMVVVVDEYGQTAGIATMEDLLEEIVGEITDEHDPERDVERNEDGSCVVSGNFDLDHLADLFEFRPDEETESTTVGGLVSEWLGHVPKVGECVERDGIRIEVTASDERRVSQVRIAHAVKEVQDDNGRN